MSNPNYYGWKDQHPTAIRPMYVRFDPSKGVRRTGKDDGVTVHGATAGFSKTETVNVPDGRLTLYDSYFGPPSARSALTNPFTLYVNDKGYWQVDSLDSGDVVLASIEDAEAAKPYNASGPSTSGGGSKNMTKEQLQAAIAWSVTASEGAAEGSSITAGDAFAKILGCAMFIDWEAAPEEPRDTNDADIPF